MQKSKGFVSAVMIVVTSGDGGLRLHAHAEVGR